MDEELKQTIYNDIRKKIEEQPSFEDITQSIQEFLKTRDIKTTTSGSSAMPNYHYQPYYPNEWNQWNHTGHKYITSQEYKDQFGEIMNLLKYSNLTSDQLLLLFSCLIKKIELDREINYIVGNKAVMSLDFNKFNEQIENFDSEKLEIISKLIYELFLIVQQKLVEKM